MLSLACVVHDFLSILRFTLPKVNLYIADIENRLHKNKKSFSYAMDQVFLFTFNGVLIVFERRKIKQNRQGDEDAL